MHWINWVEALIAVGCGFMFYLIGAGRFPGDTQKRRKLEMTMPWVKNRAVMYGGAALLVALGALRFAGQVT
jgi:hypothetical protein